MNELDPKHQAVAETARAKVMELINKARLLAAEVVIGEIEDEQ
jgi:hypothetical protein